MVTIIPKAAPKESLWQSLLFYFSLGLFVAVILSYFIIGNLEKRTADNIKGVQIEIDQVADKDDIITEGQVLAIKEKTEAFSLLFEDYRKPSRFFEMLEKNMHPDVQFNKIELGPVRLKAELEGSAPNFRAVGQQLYILQREPSIKEITLTDLSLGVQGEAVFFLELYYSWAQTLTVSRDGSGSGTITSNPVGIKCGTSCSADYKHTTFVTLTAVADPDSYFVGWSGDCSGVGDCKLSMDADKEVIAVFEKEASSLHILPMVFK